ncbi:hypothetical protein BJV82DRAFT_504137 [Fennellomyces sp. T-0311]|nr:hypothetical protein BJV82DRAFT_504137 [Fennellomyces sp. T-0311]
MLTTSVHFAPPHAALSIPEIVTHILSFISAADSKQAVSLIQCMRVSRLWHECAFRLVWRDVVFDESKYSALVKWANTIDEFPVEQDEIVTAASSLAVANNPIIKSSSLLSNCLDYFFMPPTPPATEEDAFSKPSRYIPFYRCAVRSLTLHKIKKENVNSLLCEKVARHCTRIEHMDLYICDHVKDSTLLPFIRHGRLTHLSLAGCYQVTDESIVELAHHCRQLQHLDLRACGQISDISISAIATHCPTLKHLNIGRVRDRHRITVQSIKLVATNTQVAVLGLAGCQIDDECMLVLAQNRHRHLERISVNSCHRITNATIRAYADYCPNLSVFEMKECHLIDDWETVARLAQRKVLMTLCEQQDRACAAWAKRKGVPWTKGPRV